MVQESSPYDVLDVAREIVEYSRQQANKEKSPYFVNTFKLHTMLFYAQGAFLAKRNRPLFSERLVTTDWGIKVDSKEFRDRYRRYGIANIPDAYYGKALDYNEAVISPKDKALLHSVVDVFKDKSNTASLEIVREDRLYQKNWVPGMEISVTAMKAAFSERLNVKEKPTPKETPAPEKVGKVKKLARGLLRKIKGKSAGRE